MNGNVSWIFNHSSQDSSNSKSVLSNFEVDQLLVTEKENYQNKSSKKIITLYESADLNFLAPDEDKLNKILGQAELSQFDVSSALRES
jgi:hypothetical protein